MRFGEIYALRDSARSLAAVAVFTAPTRKRLGHGPDAPRIKESMVSADYFQVLGVRPEAGRFFVPDDDRPDAGERAAVISYGFWRRNFGGSTSAIGTRFTTSGMEFVVVGIAPRGFAGLTVDAADVWVTLGAAAPTRIQADWKNWRGLGASAVARLAPGVRLDAANAEATLLVRRLPPLAQERSSPERTVQFGSLIPARGVTEQSAEVKVSTRLAVASVLVLLVACANLASLLLVRALTRKREIALRLAVGISRRRLVGQLLVESLLLSVAGATTAIVVAYWGGSVLRTLVFPESSWASGPVDLRVLLVAIVTAIVVALLAGLAPAIRMTRSDVAMALRSSAPQIAVSTGRFRQSLIVLQVALSVILIVGATVFAQSLRRANSLDVGYDLHKLVAARVFLETDTQSAAGLSSMMLEAAQRVLRLPGVERASVAQNVPLMGNSMTGVWVPGRADADDPSLRFAVYYSMSAELATMIGLRLMRGRGLVSDDANRGAAPVMLVAETMARRLWPGANAIGQCVRVGADTAPCTEVVGVIRDFHYQQLREETPMEFIRPAAIGESGSFGLMLVARVSGDPSRAVPAIRESLKGLHRDLATLEIRPLSALLDREYRPLRLGTTMFGVFALLAIVLSGVGLYGLLAFNVAHRTSEIGIRAALGARAGDLVRMVSVEGLRLCALGLAIGAMISWLAGASLEKLLFNTSAQSAAPYLVATGILALVGAVASVVPVRRVTRIDPAIALRSE